jgi:hypothetical protein
LQTNEGFLTDVVRLKEKIQKVYGEDDSFALKVVPKEHSPFTLELSLVTKSNYSKTILPFYP